jgi:peptide methionine sulfoxide reductase MsrB
MKINMSKKQNSQELTEIRFKTTFKRKTELKIEAAKQGEGGISLGQYVEQRLFESNKK